MLVNHNLRMQHVNHFLLMLLEFQVHSEGFFDMLLMDLVEWQLLDFETKRKSIINH
jgi:hypothetical protein